MSEWMDAEERLPPRDRKYMNLSVDVEFMLFDGTVVKGFYNYGNGEYYMLRQSGGYKLLGFERIMAFRFGSENNG